MATLRIGSYGERMDVLLRQGGTFGPYTATMKNPDGTAVDLTGCLIRGQLRKKALDTTIVATLDCAITNATGGVYTFGLSAATTAAIPAGEKVTDRASQYVWDLELVDSSGRVIPLYYGPVIILREVTR